MRIASCLGLLIVLSGLVTTSTALAAPAKPITPGSFTIVILPDTQHYSLKYPDIFDAQTKWIADHVKSHNIRMVIHEGDITHLKKEEEFQRATCAMNWLAEAGVPYTIAPGNHDYRKDRSTDFNKPEYFGPGSPYATQPSIGGFFEDGKTDNSYSTFRAGGHDWLVFSTEFAPRDQVVDWINKIASEPRFADHKIILNTHAYLYIDSTRYDWAAKKNAQKWSPYQSPLTKLPGGVNDGQQLWDKLVKKHKNWIFAFNGHCLANGTGYLTSQGEHGNPVHQILVNFQMLKEGGHGYLRIMEFLPDGDTVNVTAYSPHLGKYINRKDYNFTFSLTKGAKHNVGPEELPVKK